MQFAKFKVSTLIAIIILAGAISLYPGRALLTENYTIPSYGTLKYIPSLTLALHTDGRFIKDANNNTIILYGVWKGESLGEGCISSFAFEGEEYLTWESATTWRPDAVRATMQQMKAWGFNSYAETIWADWWIYNSRTRLGEPRDSVITEIGYRDTIKNILTIAQEFGIYVQIRLYSPEAGFGGVGEGRVEAPFPAGPYTHAGHIFPNAEAFADFWYDLAYDLAGYPNAIFTLYDEPAIDTSTWFPAAELAIQKIRQAEQDAGGYTHIIMNHLNYCGDCLWMEQWIQQGYSTENIVFSNHIYRHDDSFGSGTNSSLEFVRHYISDYGQWLPDGSGSLAYKYIIDTYNVPIMVTATGAVDPYETDDLEYETFKNTLIVLDELEIGYWGFLWYDTSVNWRMMTNSTSRAPSTANRVGQALIDAIASAPY
jgi:hypothetical protein